MDFINHSDYSTFGSVQFQLFVLITNSFITCLMVYYGVTQVDRKRSLSPSIVLGLGGLYKEIFD